MNSRLYTFLEWTMKFAYIQLLWILFTLAGALILGFYPATTSMFSIIRDWLNGKKDLTVFGRFWQYYKSGFINSNKLGFFLTILLSLITLDILFIQSSSNELISWTYAPLFAFMLIFALFLFYLFPAYAHYDLPLPKLVKNAFLIMLVSPLHTVLIAVTLLSLYFIMRVVPPLFFIFGGSLYALVTTWICLHSFRRIEQKQTVQ